RVSVGAYRTVNGLADPPDRVRRELVPPPPVELLAGVNQPDRSFLDQVEKRDPVVLISLGDQDDEAEIRLDHALLCCFVAALDPLRELNLFGAGQEWATTDVAQIERERVGGERLVIGHELTVDAAAGRS